MDVYRALTPLSDKTAVALGIFDGVHRGHQAVLSAAAASGFRPVALTFSFAESQPTRKQGVGRILSDPLFLRKIEQCGIDAVEILPFETIRELSPAEFVRTVLSDCLHTEVVVCGADFRFGKNAAGDVSVLRALCAPLGIRVICVPPLLADGEPISSTRIRAALEAGDLLLVDNLLGEPYGFDWEVLAAEDGFLQTFPKAFQRPCSGLYQSEAELNGRITPALTQIDGDRAVTRPIGGQTVADGERILVRLLGKK